MTIIIASGVTAILAVAIALYYRIQMGRAIQGARDRQRRVEYLLLGIERATRDIKRAKSQSNFIHRGLDTLNKAGMGTMHSPGYYGEK